MVSTVPTQNTLVSTTVPTVSIMPYPMNSDESHCSRNTWRIIGHRAPAHAEVCSQCRMQNATLGQGVRNHDFQTSLPYNEVLGSCRAHSLWIASTSKEDNVTYTHTIASPSDTSVRIIAHPPNKALIQWEPKWLRWLAENKYFDAPCWRRTKSEIQ